MKVTIEGQVYDFDKTLIRNRECIQIERETGMTTGRWETALSEGSVLAMTALVWMVYRQNGQPDLEFGDVEFDPRQVETDDPAEESGKDQTEAPEPEN